MKTKLHKPRKSIKQLETKIRELEKYIQGLKDAIFLGKGK